MKLFVWDYHGVMEQGTENAVLEITNIILKEAGYDCLLTAEENNRLYGRKWFEYFEFLLPEEPYERHFQLQQNCVAMQFSHPEVVAKHIRPADFLHDVLQAIRDAQHDQILISNVNPEAYSLFVSAVGADQYFDKTRGFAVNGHRKGNFFNKQVILEAYLQGKEFDDIVIIGDSPKDMELAQVAGGVTYLYAHPYRTHRECEAKYKISDLREVLREV